MGKLCWSSIVLSFVLTVAQAQDSVPSTVIESTATEVAPGDSFNVSCRVSNLKTPNFFRLEKYQSGSEIPVDLMTNGFLAEPVKVIDRYTGSYGADEAVFIFTFSVRDAMVEDSGEYTCTVFGDNIRIVTSQRHSINVIVEPAEVVLVVTDPATGEEVYIEDDTAPFEFEEEVRRHIRCEARGVSPEPVMRLLVGSNDLTPQFMDSSEMRAMSNPDLPVLIGYSYDVTMSAEDVLVDNSFVRSGFECRVTVGSHQLSKKFSVKLQGFAPEFDNCSSSLVSYNGEQDVRYTCRVFASPAPSISFYFFLVLESNDTLKVEIPPGGKYSQYRFLEYEDGEDVEVVIHMTMMFPQMFRNHFLVAENEAGERVHEVEFIRDLDMEVTVAASHHNKLSLAAFCFLIITQILLHW